MADRPPLFECGPGPVLGNQEILHQALNNSDLISISQVLRDITRLGLCTRIRLNGEKPVALLESGLVVLTESGVNHDFLAAQSSQFILHRKPTRKRGDLEFTGRQIGISERITGRQGQYRSQVIIGLRSARLDIHRGPWGDQLDHLTLDHPHCELRIFHLFTDGNLVALIHQNIDIASGCMMRYTRHRNGIIRIFIPRRERQFEQLRALNRIIIK